MKISTFKDFMGDAGKNLNRNKTISTASIATVAATLFILGVFLLTITNIKGIMREIESQVEVKVILRDDIKINDQQNIERTLKEVPGVEDVILESKGQALENLKNKLGEQYQSLLDGLEKENPMPTSYIVKVEKPEIVSTVVEKVKGMSGIETVKDGREIVEKIIAISNAIRWVGIVIFVILIGVSLFLIGNTIKLTVYARRREIGIMKYIGATDWFIRWPFILEGIFIGVLGAVVAAAVLYFGYKFAYGRISTDVLMIQLVDPAYILNTISWQFMLGGVFIGVVGSVTAIRKFLSV